MPFFIVLFSVIIALLLAMLRVYHKRVEGVKQKLRQSVRQRKEAMDFLSIFTTSLSTSSEANRAMELVAHYLSDVVEAEGVCVFQVVDDRGEQKLQASAVAGIFPLLQRSSNMVVGRDPSAIREHLRRGKITFGDGVIGRVAELQRNMLIEDASLLPENEKLPTDVRTVMAVPMISDNRLIGVIAAANSRRAGHLFDGDDLRTLESLSSQAAMACHLVSIYSERTRQQRIVEELDLARKIQASLLPEYVPAMGEYRIHAFTRSANEVGGDFYDFIEMDEYRTMVVVADASGKGVPASMLMAMCRSFAKVESERYTMMEQFMANLNRHLCRDSDSSHFVTLAVLIIDRQNHVCEYACAGHTELLTRLETGQTRIIKPDGPALGLLPDDFSPKFDTFAFSFSPGTSIMLFSDGISEALNENGAEYGLDRLFKVWTDSGDLPPERMSEKIMDDVKEFTGEAPQADDQTVLLISRPKGKSLVHSAAHSASVGT